MRVWQFKPDPLILSLPLAGTGLLRETRSKRATTARRIKRSVSGSFASGHARHQTSFFGLLLRGLLAKTLRRNIGGGNLKMKKQMPNINMVRSAWRRVKKDIKDAIIRDLKPVKDVKGGGRAYRGESNSTTGEGTRGTRSDP
jgi:hypothetical protein